MKIYSLHEVDLLDPLPVLNINDDKLIWLIKQLPTTIQLEMIIIIRLYDNTTLLNLI